MVHSSSRLDQSRVSTPAAREDTVEAGNTESSRNTVSSSGVAWEGFGLEPDGCYNDVVSSDWDAGMFPVTNPSSGNGLSYRGP